MSYQNYRQNLQLLTSEEQFSHHEISSTVSWEELKAWRVLEQKINSCYRHNNKFEEDPGEQQKALIAISGLQKRLWSDAVLWMALEWTKQSVLDTFDEVQAEGGWRKVFSMNVEVVSRDPKQAAELMATIQSS